MHDYLEKNQTDPECCKQYYSGSASESSIFFYKLRRKEEYCNRSPDKEPAFFGLTDANKLSIAKREGRIYDPNGRHTWQRNLSWVLGAIHKGRDIILNSRVDGKNIWRKDVIPRNNEALRRSSFSAFAREIAAAKKAGYSECLKDGAICLSANLKERKHLKISNIDPDPNEIEQAVKEIHSFIISKIEKAFATNGEDNALGDYIDYCMLSNNNMFQSDENCYWSFYLEFLTVKDSKMLELLNLISKLASNGFIYQKDDHVLIEEFGASKIKYEELKLLSNSTSSSMERAPNNSTTNEILEQISLRMGPN